MGLDSPPSSTCVRLTPFPLRVDVINGWPLIIIDEVFKKIKRNSLNPTVGVTSTRVFMLTCVHASIHTRIRKDMPIIITHIYTHIHTCIHTYIHTYIYIYIHSMSYIHTYIYLRTCMHAFTYIHTYIHKYIHTYIHTYMHTYIYTYIYIYI